MRWFLPLLLVGCASAPEGLRPTPPGFGPLVRVDWDHEPLADIPFPTDLATRPDPTSPTGKRLNLPVGHGIAMEQAIIAELNQSTGWGLFTPLTVGFESPLDLDELKARHPDDLHVDGHFLDDAVYLIDVTEGSPDYLQAQPLDLGGGRFPQQLTRPTSLLANDPRAPEGSSLLFETTSEDLDGDGVLDLGEDTDGDGVLDLPNLWPADGHPFHDLATFYERSTDTLIVRPVMPLREQTTYAVVVTERLVGLDGEPVRSPWEWVNHTRQTPDLQPLADGVPEVGLALSDIAFAWTFTTGAVTRDLHEVSDGLLGTGPYASLADDYPAGVTEAAVLHTIDDQPPTVLPPGPLVSPLLALGIFDETSLAFVIDTYETYTEGFVGGAITSPYLLADTDGDGADVDEHWRLDRAAGTVTAAPRRVPFTCAVPRVTEEHQPPFPIVIHGHGLGSTRVEFIGFAWALNRLGIAVCALDAPGHGLSLGEDFDPLIAAFLAAVRAEPTWWHLTDAAMRDLDNDGVIDASADQFTADVLHTRDMLRQPVVDWTQLIRSLQSCGEGTMELMLPTADGPVPQGEQRVSCDWNGDGVPDLGGPGTRFRYHGISMGGLEGGLATAVLPDLDAAVLTVPGGGLFDIGIRSDIGSVVDGLVNRALSPLILGVPTEAGVELRQQVISLDDNVQLPFAVLPEVPAGGRIEVTNLDREVTQTLRVPSTGGWRVPIVADALPPEEKAVLAGIPTGGVEPGERYSVPDNEGLGDRLLVEVFDARGRSVARVDTFDRRTTFEGVTYEAGSPLVAASWGFGYTRGSADLRRAVSVLSSVVEPGDPIAYARQWYDEPEDNPREVLIALTIGDASVPQATGVALARAAGIVDFSTPDPRYGTSVDRWLIERGVVQGQEEWGPYVASDGSPILFDPDDLDEGTDDYDAPSEAPLRATIEAGDGQAGLRFLYVNPRGSHAYLVPDQTLGFDVHAFGAQQMAWFLFTEGGEVLDDPCLATPSGCDFLPPVGP
jgi:hypothetical protein